MNSYFSVFRLSAFLLVGATVAGCSTIVNAHRQKIPMMDAYVAADITTALGEVNDKLSEGGTFSSSRVGTGDEMMWQLESGSLNFVAGNYKESIAAFERAEDLITESDDRATVNARDAGSEIAFLASNLNALPYRGYFRDRIVLSFYKALAYLGDRERDDPQGAFSAQVRRLREAQKDVMEKYEKIFAEEKAELDRAKEQHADEANQMEEMDVDKIAENDRNQEFATGLSDMKQTASRGYGSFLNPAATYLSAIDNLRNEDYGNAAIEFVRLCKAMPDQQVFKRYLVTALNLAGRPIPSELKTVKPFEFSLERDCVFVIFANGRSAALKQIGIYFPVMTAWPVCEYYPAVFDNLRVNGVSTEPLADMDGVFSQEFMERLPVTISRIVLNTLVKEGAYHVAVAAASRNTYAKWAVMLVGIIYRAAMNTADTRTWETLPKEFQMTQLPMPANRTLDLQLGSQTRPVTIPSDYRSAIVFVSAPSEQNISVQVLPFTSVKEQSK